eukprot:m.882507 g.882507  ORF g.882507 m.882507 type:complete len:226 (+) comp23597_c0_seq38:359-1036(+)
MVTSMHGALRIFLFILHLSRAVAEISTEPSLLDQQHPVLRYNTTLLERSWEKLHHGDTDLNLVIAELERAAQGHISAGPFSVLNSSAVRPSGDNHDYMSTAVYWWPCAHVAGTGPCDVSTCAHAPCNCTSMDICGKTSVGCNATTGLPWFSCDGHENYKSIDEGCLPQLAGLHAAVVALADAFYWTRNETYVDRMVGQQRANITAFHVMHCPQHSVVCRYLCCRC